MAYNVLETCVLLPGLTHSACAAWVQAWGSILAIVAAIGIAWWQRREDRVATRLRARVRAELAGTAILLMMNPLLGQIAAAQARVGTESDGVSRQDITAARKILMAATFPTEQELGDVVEFDPGLARLLIQGRNLMRQAAHAAGLVEEHWTDPPRVEVNAFLQSLRELLQATHGRFQLAMKGLDALVPEEQV